MTRSLAGGGRPHHAPRQCSPGRGPAGTARSITQNAAGIQVASAHRPFVEHGGWARARLLPRARLRAPERLAHAYARPTSADVPARRRGNRHRSATCFVRLRLSCGGSPRKSQLRDRWRDEGDRQRGPPLSALSRALDSSATCLYVNEGRAASAVASRPRARGQIELAGGARPAARVLSRGASAPAGLTREIRRLRSRTRRREPRRRSRGDPPDLIAIRVAGGS